MKIEIGKVTDFDMGKPVPVEVNGQKMMVVRTEAGLFALENVCPHQSQPLDTGTVTGNHLKCRNHGLIVELSTGEIVDDAGYIGLDGAKAFTITLEGNQVFVQV